MDRSSSSSSPPSPRRKTLPSSTSSSDSSSDSDSRSRYPTKIASSTEKPRGHSSSSKRHHKSSRHSPSKKRHKSRSWRDRPSSHYDDRRGCRQSGSSVGHSSNQNGYDMHRYPDRPPEGSSGGRPWTMPTFQDNYNYLYGSGGNGGNGWNSNSDNYSRSTFNQPYRILNVDRETRLRIINEDREQRMANLDSPADRGAIIRNWQDMMHRKIQRDKQKNYVAYGQLKSEQRRLQDERRILTENIDKMEAEVKEKLDGVAEDAKANQRTLDNLTQWEIRLKEREEKCTNLEKAIVNLEDRILKQRMAEHRLKQRQMNLQQEELKVKQEKNTILQILKRCQGISEVAKNPHVFLAQNQSKDDQGKEGSIMRVAKQVSSTTTMEKPQIEQEVRDAMELIVRLVDNNGNSGVRQEPNCPIPAVVCRPDTTEQMEDKSAVSNETLNQ